MTFVTKEFISIDFHVLNPILRCSQIRYNQTKKKIVSQSNILNLFVAPESTLQTGYLQLSWMYNTHN